MGSQPAAARQLGTKALAPLCLHVRATEIMAGEYFMHEVYRRVFPRMLKKTAPDILLYPFENRSWEKILLTAAAPVVRRRIGYQHSSITPRHLAFHVQSGEIPAGFLPDRIYTIGEITAGYLRRTAPGFADRLEAGVSFRAARQAVAEVASPAVLVAISSSSNEALSLLQITHAAASRVDLPFIVRSHPTIPADALYRLFDWPRNVELSTGSTLARDLSRTTMVAYSSSTVALEGMLYGRLPIFVDIGDIPSGDPIMGDHPFRFHARDGASLAAAMTGIVALGAKELDELRREARHFAERYLGDPDPAAASRMADSILRS